MLIWYYKVRWGLDYLCLKVIVSKKSAKSALKYDQSSLSTLEIANILAVFYSSKRRFIWLKAGGAKSSYRKTSNSIFNGAFKFFLNDQL